MPVTIDNAEHLIINGQGGNDTLTVTGTAGSNRFVHTPGSTIDSGAVAVDSLLAVAYTNFGAVGTVTLAANGGSDTLVARGTAANDRFDVSVLGSVNLQNDAGDHLDLLITAGVDALLVEGFDGDDLFVVAGAAIYSQGVRIHAGDPSGSDRVTLNATANPDFISLSLLPQGDSVSGIVTGAVTLVNVEVLTINADLGNDTVNVIQTGNYTDLQLVDLNLGNGAGDALDIEGTGQPDHLLYTPTGASDGTVWEADAGPVIDFSGVGGTFELDGTGNVDKITVNGQSNADLIRVILAATTTVQVDALKTVSIDTATNEALTVQGDLGNDTFHVVPGATLGDGLLLHLDGGSPPASDALVITNLDVGNNPIPLAATDFVVVGHSRTPDAGNILVYQAAVRRPGIAYENIEVVSPNVFVAAGDPNLLILGPDNYEENEFRTTAAYLGSAAAINVPHLAIFPNDAEHPGVPADQDFFRVVAGATGTLDFRVFFRVFSPALLPAAGDLNIQVLDIDGTVIAGSGPLFGTNDATGDERIRIPAVAGQTYYLRVFGADGRRRQRLQPDGDQRRRAGALRHWSCWTTRWAIRRRPTATPAATTPTTSPATTRPRSVFRLDDGFFLNDLPGNNVPDTPPDEVIPIPFQRPLSRCCPATRSRSSTRAPGRPSPARRRRRRWASPPTSEPGVYHVHHAGAAGRLALPHRPGADDRPGHAHPDRLGRSQPERWRSSSTR